MKGKSLEQYAKGAIEHLDRKIDNAQSYSRRERLSERREYWTKMLGDEMRQDDEREKLTNDIKAKLPGVRVFQMPADREALADFLIERRDKRLTAKAVDEVMKEYGDGTAQGE